MRRGRIPEVTVRRLPVYLRVLGELAEQRVEVVSSAELARRTGFSSEQIRKDLAYFGAFGTRGVGYGTELLRARIRQILGLDRGVRAALVGAGNLGTALARYVLARDHGVRIVAIFDSDPARVGVRIGGVEVQPAERLEQVCRELGVRIGVVAVPAAAAQTVAERLARAGVTALLNFAPVRLRLDPAVYVQDVDLSLALQSLAYYAADGPPAPPAEG